MDPQTITEENFLKLGQGSVVLWRGLYTRTVLFGPADHTQPNKRQGLGFPIRRRSWTGRITTTCGWHDLKQKIAYTGKSTRTLFNLGELERLTDAGFDIEAQLKREMAEFLASSQAPNLWYQRDILQKRPGFCVKVFASLNALAEAKLL